MRRNYRARTPIVYVSIIHMSSLINQNRLDLATKELLQMSLADPARTEDGSLVKVPSSAASNSEREWTRSTLLGKAPLCRR